MNVIYLYFLYIIWNSVTEFKQNNNIIVTSIIHISYFYQSLHRESMIQISHQNFRNVLFVSCKQAIIKDKKIIIIHCKIQVNMHEKSQIGD